MVLLTDNDKVIIDSGHWLKMLWYAIYKLVEAKLQLSDCFL